MSRKKINFDNASITPIDLRVARVVAKFSTENFANPSSLHAEGQNAKSVMDSSREDIAALLHAHSDEIIFTASGTEANNLAIKGLFEEEIRKGKKPEDLHIITTKIEHSSILETVRYLSCRSRKAKEDIERKGAKVSYIGVDENGIVDLKELKREISKKTFLVSIHHVNNEIGVIQPIPEIAKAIRNFRKVNNLKDSIYPILHVDACQSLPTQEIDLRSFGADMISLDGQKINGPRGVGLLYKKRSIDIEPVIHGGGQEMGLRSGTENVAAIAGLEKAMHIIEDEREKNIKNWQKLNKKFLQGIKKFTSIEMNSGEFSAPNIINFSIKGIDNEFFILQLDASGIMASTKSSCLRDEGESYVVRALGKKKDRAMSSVRISFGPKNTLREVEMVLKRISEILEK